MGAACGPAVDAEPPLTEAAGGVERALRARMARTAAMDARRICLEMRDRRLRSEGGGRVVPRGLGQGTPYRPRLLVLRPLGP